MCDEQNVSNLPGAEDVIEIRPVRAADYIPSIGHLLRAHWREMDFGFKVEVNVSVEMYAEMQDAGVLFALFAFRGDEVIGYSTATVTPHPFNPALTLCSSDALYVAPEYRKGFVAYKLIKETERTAKARGAHVMTWHTRAGTPLAKMFELRGYRPADVCVMREL